MKIKPYLTFKGQCQEAIDLYSNAFKTKASEVMRFSDLPKNPERVIPESQKNWILQATIPFGDNYIRLSDCGGDHPLDETPTERIAINIECSVEEVKHAFAVLSEEGEVGISLQKTFFSPCHGVVFDKFGVMWNFVAQ
ncbi:hypothetical protein EZS27_012106 [termite gut metagenome]|uniref:PhnB-like domain-containing protein n=1 Tax=termite gut metagenome TaxID=433724 RepID=A0A5J4S3I0_9ZZZZ